MVDALRLLLENPAPDDSELESIKQGFRSGLAHAEHCGSLISLMSRLDEQQRSESLKLLVHLREQGGKWTELANCQKKDG